MDIVINRCFGGFGLSDAAAIRYAEITGVRIVPHGYYGTDDTEDEYFLANNETKPNVVFSYEIPRTDPVLALIVRELGELVNTKSSALKVVAVPDGVNWCI